MVAKLKLANIQKFMNVPRIFRVVGKQTQAQGKPEFLSINQESLAIDPETGDIITKILNNVTEGKFDATISQVPYGPNTREKEFLKLIDLMKFAIEIDPVKASQMLPVVIEASDSAYYAEFMKVFQDMDENKNNKEAQVQSAMLALQQAFQQLQLDKGRAEVQNKYIQNEQDKAETEGKQLDNEKKKKELQDIDQNVRIKAALNSYLQSQTGTYA